MDCCVQLELDTAISTVSKLSVYGADLWQSEDKRGLGQVVSAEICIKPGQDLPFLNSVKVGKGSISLVAAVFPSEDELQDGTEAYRVWAPWLEDLLLRVEIRPHWQCDNKKIELSILSGGGKRIICAVNPTSKMQSGNVRLPENRSMRMIDIWPDLGFGDPEGESRETNRIVVESKNTLLESMSFRVKLEPYTVSIWEIV